LISEHERNNFNFESLFGSKARIKILRILCLNHELSISQIIKKTRLNHSCALKHLNYLKSASLIQEKRFGRIKIYRYKIENFKAKSLKIFIDIWEGKH